MQDVTNNTEIAGITEEQIKAVWEHTHVHDLGNGTVKLVNGISQCVRKVHRLPEYMRTEE